MHAITFCDKWGINTSLIFEYLSTLETFRNVAAKEFRATGWVSEALKQSCGEEVSHLLSYSVLWQLHHPGETAVGQS